MSDSDKHWTSKQLGDLANLASSGLFLNIDLALKLNRKPQAVGRALKKLGIKNQAIKFVIGKWNNKYAHLYGPVLVYFMDHSFEETMARFKLTKSELRSLFTVGYRKPEFAHLRKDHRRRDSWSAYEYKFMLQHLGIMPREWIANRLKRGGVEAVRGKIDKLEISSKSVNGLTISQFREAFGVEPSFYIKTKAGPTGGITRSSHFKIIPWVWLDSEIKTKRLKAHKIFQELIKAMALFQDWVHDGDAIGNLQKIARKRI